MTFSIAVENLVRSSGCYFMCLSLSTFSFLLILTRRNTISYAIIIHYQDSKIIYESSLEMSLTLSFIKVLIQSNYFGKKKVLLLDLKL